MTLIDELLGAIQKLPSDGNGDLILKAADFRLDFMKAFWPDYLR